MIDLKSMIQNESVFDVIAFLSGRNEGINYIHLDRFYGQHRFDAIAEGELLLTFQKMCREKVVQGNGRPMTVGKGPNWVEPKFMTEKKYGIE